MSHKRREFSKAIRVEVIKRSTKNNVVYCESCGLPAKKFQIDHARADSLLGAPTLENAMLICEPCFLIKNAADAESIARAARQEAVHVGAEAPSSRPFAKRPPKPPKRQPRPALPPRKLYQRIGS